MASTVLVKLRTVPFPQGKKSSPDRMPLSEINESLNKNKKNHTINIDKAAQLEQNMKFLQEQHQATLIALHQEVETLRQKNRDLQFQLVFSKGSTYTPSSPSSPEDSGFIKAQGTPPCVNISPLQVELLEKELQDTKISLQEIKSQNQNLSEIIELQKKKLNTAEEQIRNKQSTVDVGIRVWNKIHPVQTNLFAYLAASSATIKRLLEQHEQQKKEIAMLKATSTNTGNSRGARSRGSNNSHHSRESPTNSLQEQTINKFPPLQSQSYWNRRVPRNGRNRHDKTEHQTEMDSTVLPELQNGNMKSDTMVFESPFYRSRGYRNYYRDDNNRKYRGHGSHKDRRNNENHHHQFSDSAEGSREGNNSACNKS